MSITYVKFFAPAVLGTVAASLLTVPAQPTTMLLRGARVRLLNTSTLPASATLYAVPAGGTAAPGNAFLSNRSINPNDHLDIDVPIMAAGDSLQGLAGTANAITIQPISGSYFA